MKMYKGLRRGALVVVANEQKIGKMNSLFKEKEQQKLLVRMNKKQKRGAIIVAANEEKIEKKSFLFKEKE
jgi:hypothetical protein